MNKNHIVYFLVVISIIVSSYYLFFIFTCKHVPLRTLPVVQEKLSQEKNIVPVVVIGSGPAGLSAALYTARADYKTMVIAGPKEGGQLTEASYVENWPAKEKMTGLAMMHDLKRQVEHFGVQILTASVDTVNLLRWPFEIHIDTGEKIKALSIIIATGGSQQLMSVPGVDKYLGKGIGVCTICDAPFEKGKSVVVIGGGDAAADKALQLATFAKDVTILVRDEKMHAAAIIQKYLQQAKNITVRCMTDLVEVRGDEQHVHSVVVKDLKTAKTDILNVRGVYFALGFVPNTQFLKNTLACDAAGYILTRGKSQATSLEGVFAAGNVEDAVYQKASVAAGNGIKAALDSIEFLQKHGITPSSLAPLRNNMFVPEQIVKKVALLTSRGQLQSIFLTQSLVLLDCYVMQCPLCSMISKILEQAAAQLHDQVHVVKVDINKVPEVKKQFNVEHIPTLILLRNGKEIARTASVYSVRDINQFVQEHKNK